MKQLIQKGQRGLVAKTARELAEKIKRDRNLKQYIERMAYNRKNGMPQSPSTRRQLGLPERATQSAGQLKVIPKDWANTAVEVSRHDPDQFFSPSFYVDYNEQWYDQRRQHGSDISSFFNRRSAPAQTQQERELKSRYKYDSRWLDDFVKESNMHSDWERAPEKAYDNGSSYIDQLIEDMK